VQIAGKRYNPRRGMLKISCDRHRAREENKRQTLHWALRLVEVALHMHPSEEWEDLKRRQQELALSLDIGDEKWLSVQAAQLPSEGSSAQAASAPPA
jgi:hypothetical protein